MPKGNRNRGQANKNEKVNKTTTNSSRIQETSNDQITMLEKSNAEKMTSDSPPRAEKKPTKPNLFDFTDIGSDDSIDMAELMKQLDTEGVAKIEIDFTKDDGDLDLSFELRGETEDNSRKISSRFSETETPDCEKKLKMDTNQPQRTNKILMKRIWKSYMMTEEGQTMNHRKHCKTLKSNTDRQNLSENSKFSSKDVKSTSRTSTREGCKLRYGTPLIEHQISSRSTKAYGSTATARTKNVLS